MTPPPDRAVLTIATGKPIYLRMACHLARSFLVWHRESHIKFFIATDQPFTPPADLAGISVLRFKPGELGEGFSAKLHLDRLAPASETLFIDADCLCSANLDMVFERFKDREVSVVGREESQGELFGDIAARCRAVGVAWVPRFCGGLYYLRRGKASEAIFQKARELEGQYDQLGLGRLRGLPNEEPLVGLAMALAGQRPVPDDATIKAEPMFFSGRTELDVFAGTARLFNVPGRPRPYPEWKIPDEAHPAIVHFNCAFAEQPPYTTEALRLEKVLKDRWPLPFATAYAGLKCTLPFKVQERVKSRLRPCYRALFGTRPVRRSARA